MGNEQLHIPAGFAFSSACAGIKVSGRADVAYAEAIDGATAAAVFTRNRVVAAPVEVGRDHLKRGKGRIRAVIVNSGNANCATGAAGLKAADNVCREVAKLLGIAHAAVFPSSTGIIGVPLASDKIVGVLPQLMAAKQSNAEAAQQFARAIMTTDTRAKMASSQLQCGKQTVNLLGIAKGAGMIHPNMATMLVYIFSDVGAAPADLKRHLFAAVNGTFNCISVDGDTSTNDTVLLLASGSSGCSLKQRGVEKKFAQALQDVCGSLAEQIVSDGEGVEHVVRLHIEQARDRREARTVARAIANSPLVKTALAGCDPNWGRILAAVGYSGAVIDPACVNIYFGPQQVCRKGAACGFDERAAHQYISQPCYEIRVELGRGRTQLRFLTCDLTAEYVRINAEYST